MSEEDFRKQLYAGYVSAFKSENLDESPQAQAAFDRWADARYLPHLAHLARDARIVELGCGPGRMLQFLKSRGYTNVAGVDISDEQAAIARRRGLDATTGDITEYLARHPGAFDAVIMIDVVEHFTKPELLRLFKLVHDGLKPRGVVLYQTANGEGIYPNQVIYGDLTHTTILSVGSSEQLLRATGFDKFVFAETSPVPSGAKGVLRALAWRLITFSASLVRRIETGKRQRVWTENFICRAERA